MNCYNHTEKVAVAVCKSCGRALCMDCVAHVDKSVSCTNRCEADVELINDLMKRGSTAYQKTGAVYLRSGIFILLLGIVMLGFGLSTAKSGLGYFLIPMGSIFSLWSFTYFYNAKKFKEK